MTSISRNISLPTGLQGMPASPQRRASTGHFLMYTPDFTPWDSANVFTSMALVEFLSGTKEQQNVITRALSQMAAGPGFANP
jgi:hypothetical protein